MGTYYLTQYITYIYTSSLQSSKSPLFVRRKPQTPLHHMLYLPNHPNKF